MKRHAVLIPGNAYKNKNGGYFKCLAAYDDEALMINTKSGWKFKACVITLYDDGTIEWNYSTSGRFEKLEGLR